MKKHAGMARVTKNSKIEECCTRKLQKLWLESSSNSLASDSVASLSVCSSSAAPHSSLVTEHLEKTPPLIIAAHENRLKHHIDSLIQSVSLSDQISHLKQLVSLIRNEELVSTAEVKLVVKVFLILFFDVQVQKCPLHKAVASCVDTIHDIVASKSIDVSLEQMMSAYVMNSSNAKSMLLVTAVFGVVLTLVQSAPTAFETLHYNQQITMSEINAEANKQLIEKPAQKQRLTVFSQTGNGFLNVVPGNTGARGLRIIPRQANGDNFLIRSETYYDSLVTFITRRGFVRTGNEWNGLSATERLVRVGDKLVAREFIFTTKCLVESPAQSVRYKTVIKYMSVLTPVFTRYLVTCLQQLDLQSCEDIEARSDNVSLAHTACQVYFRLLTITRPDIDCDLTQTYGHVRPVLHHTLINGHGNMDLLISVGLCITQLCCNKSQLEDGTTVQSEVESLLSRDDITTEEKYFAQCCLLNGIVSCFKNLSLPLHRLILHTCVHLMSTKMNTSSLLVFTKMLVNWSNALSLSTSYKEFIKQEVYEPLLDYLWLVWEHSAEAVRQCSREIFANLLKAVTTDDVLRLRTLKLLASYSWSCKGKYGFLLEYIQVVGVDETLAHITEASGAEAILEDVIAYIKQQQLANYVSEFVCCVMRNDKKCNSYTPIEWTERWLIPLVKTVQLHPESHTNVSQNLLPKIVKIWPETIVELLQRMSAASHDHVLGSCDQSSDIYLMLARRARTSGLLAEEEQGEESWCGVLNRDIISGSLHSSSSQRRLSAFALVCESHKTSSAIGEEEFVWVKEFIRDNSYQPEPSFRQQMLSHLKHFLYHVLESSRKLDWHQQRPHRDFLRDLGMMQVERAKMDALTNHRTVSLEILSLISSIFPFGTFSTT